MSRLNDERGKPSTGRLLLVLTMSYLAILVPLDAGLGDAFVVPDLAYTLLGTLVMGLLMWTAGPRIAQHIGPIGAIAAGIASAAKERGKPNEWADGKEDGLA